MLMFYWFWLLSCWDTVAHPAILNGVRRWNRLVVMYRKCTQQTVISFTRKRRLIEKFSQKGEGQQPHRLNCPLNAPLLVGVYLGEIGGIDTVLKLLQGLAYVCACHCASLGFAFLFIFYWTMRCCDVGSIRDVWRITSCVVEWMGALKMREWKIREQIAGVQSAGVENAGAITRGNPSEEIP